MSRLSKLLVAGLTASLLMGLAVATAAAGRISLSSARIRDTWISLRFRNFENEVELLCPVTLEGSFHSLTIRKTRGALVGAISRAILNNPCTGGRATLLQETLPWHMTYESFRGTLPRIEEITLLLRRYEFRLEVVILGFPVFCLYLDQGRPEENLALNLAVDRETGQSTAVTPVGGRYASWRSGSELCPRRGFLEGIGQQFLLASSFTRITITLI
jgi:hypothetical protein